MKTPNTNPQTIPTKAIIVGNRHRRDLGDTAGLADSIDEVGLLHPVVVRTDGTLIAGARRLAACKHLGWQEVPVTVLDLEEIARGEFAENAYRKDFLPSEINAIRRALEPAEKAAAKARMSEGAKVGKLPHLPGASETGSEPLLVSLVARWRKSPPWSRQPKLIQGFAISLSKWMQLGA